MEFTNFFVAQNALHSNQEQEKRQKAALELNVQLIDSAKQTGKINDYDVSLLNCSCRDFSIRRKPCKHMYRLAYEIGIFPLPGKTINDPSIKNSSSTMSDKKDLEEEVRNLSDKEKELLYLILYEYLYQGKNPIAYPKADVPSNLIKKNIITLSNTDHVEALAKHINKNNLSSFVKANSCKIKLNQKKTIILDALKNNYSDLYKSMLSEISFILPSERVLRAPRNIYKLVKPPSEEFVFF
jgi:hypothetical protein